MTCHVARQFECERLPLSRDQVDTLLDLARQGDEATFKELARCLGVWPETIDDFWIRAAARVAPLR